MRDCVQAIGLRWLFDAGCHHIRESPEKEKDLAANR